MVMVNDVAVPVNHRNDTKNYSDTYVKRFLNCITSLFRIRIADNQQTVTQTLNKATVIEI